MILILNVLVEVTIGGDQSADRNGSAGGRRSAHLNMDQSDGFEHPSRSGFERGSRNKGGGWVRGITPIVCYTSMLCTKIDCLFSPVLCQVNSLQEAYQDFAKA